jgi:hypothetical protein
VSSTPRCPSCRRFVYLDTLVCPECGTEMGMQVIDRVFVALRDGRTTGEDGTWFACSEREWGCNWLVRDDAPAGRCISCRLTRTRPEQDDTIALEKLAKVEEAKRRLLLQIGDLGLPIVPWYTTSGGLGFDLLEPLGRTQGHHRARERDHHDRPGGEPRRRPRGGARQARRAVPDDSRAPSP